MRWDYVISPAVIQFCDEKVPGPGSPMPRTHARTRPPSYPRLPALPQAKAYGPIVSGALFGAGWWFWVDAVSCSGTTIPFPQASAVGVAPLRAWALARLGPCAPAVHATEAPTCGPRSTCRASSPPWHSS
jgi:hypothetical protein